MMEGDEREPATLIGKARDEGFRHGLEVGFAKGHAAGAATAVAYNQQFAAILAGMEKSVAALDETVAAELVKLATELARQMIRSHFAIHPEAIQPVVHEALNSIAAIAQTPLLTLHPDDAELVKRDMSEELLAHRCRIAIDSDMARGGVRIEDSGFEMDATLPTRWSRTLATLGVKDDWLA